MQTPDAFDQFAHLDQQLSSEEYNFDHFRPKHLINDIKRGIAKAGILPGDVAPDFELPCADGGTLRLSDLRGTPVLLHFGSYT